ncbi:MAG: amidohydrolase [Gemmatimonadales bacterium]|nr:amidohydrolase [Gemmatimonadales bacterium]
MTVDLHTHILPKSWPDLASRYGYGGWVALEHHAPCKARMVVDGTVFREIGDNCWLPARRLEECDAHGVGVQVLSTVPAMFSYWARAEDALDLSRMLNDHIAGVVREHPRRFTGLGTVPLQSPELAAREMERCVKELGLCGVQIGTHVGEWNLDHPELFPFFEAAARLDAAVFVHPWDMLAPERMRKYWLPWLVGMPTETALAVCSVIFGGVLERLPTLKIGFAHGGGSFPGTFGRIEHGFHARPDLVAVDNPHPPSTYLRRFYVDSLTHDAEALRLLLRMHGTERVALGSDYPFPLGEERPGALIASMTDLDAPTRARLLHGTALEFLGLTPERFS